jgi:Zn-dependent metalloprotease
MRRFGILGGFSMAFIVGACAIGTVGCNSDDESSMPDVSSAASGAEARAIGHVQFDAARALIDANHELAVHSVVADLDGSEHVHFNRTYKGLRVIGGDFIVHGHVDGSYRGISKTLARPINIDLNKNIGEEAAIVSAQAEQKALPSDIASKAELVVHARGEQPVLAYEVVVHGVQLDQTPSELHVIIDAETGNVIEKWEGIETASASGTGKGYYVGTVALTTNTISGGFELKDPSRGNQYTINMGGKQQGGAIFTDADNNWGTGAVTDMPSLGVDAQYGTGLTWDYYKNVHGRNGIANDGKGAYNRVNYGRKYNNAFWSDSCFCMTYGNGDGTTFNPFDSLDVAGHEMTHGVTSRSANLTYSGESGGLNESTSDIFGTMVEFYANNPNDPGDYLIGEELYRSGTSALRKMSDPDADGASRGCWYSNLGALDVHYSSGVGNLFFYLLAEGGKAPNRANCNTSITVSGVGRDAAAKIWYRTLTVYLTSSSKYTNARAASISAANDLYGAGSAQSAAVAAAWSAVNVN